MRSQSKRSESCAACRASVGPMGSGEQLQSHPVSYAYAGTVNLASGALFDTGTAGGGAEDRKTKVHALLMIIGWGLLLPLGTLFARCKEWGPIWFHFHRICQVTAQYMLVAEILLKVPLLPHLSRWCLACYEGSFSA